MARIWKEPYSVERDVECTGHWGHPSNLVTVRPRPNTDWIYFVEVCRFTFVFFSPAEIVPYLEFYRKKGRGGRATFDAQSQYYSRWGGGPRNEHDEWQSPLERLPLRLRKEPKRQKVVKALEQALEVFAGDQNQGKKGDMH
jgi:hypothetical protein